MTGVTAQETFVAMRDGARLATDVVTADDGVPKPALLVRSPYTRGAIRQSNDLVGLARQGWAVVAQDVRGRFESDGEFDPFHQEGRDGADTVAWVAAQPWCDGRVCGFGASYLGLGQWLTALEQPSALAAIAPAVAASDVRDGWIYRGGAFELGFAASWAAQMAATDPNRSAEERQEVADLVSDLRPFYDLPLGNHPLRRLFGPFERWMDPDDSSYWEPLDVVAQRSRVQVPAFHVAGWYDIFCDSSLRGYTAMVEGAGNARARASQRLIIGPWVHTGVFMPASAEFLWGRSADGTARGYPQEMLDWLRTAMDGKPVEAGVDVYVIGSGQWLSMATWPPASTPTPWYLSSVTGANSLRGDGVLRRAPEPEAGQDHFRYEPSDPVPTRGGRTLFSVHPFAGPVDQRPVEERPDVLVYTSDPLPADILVMGEITADVMFSTDAASADVTVKVVDVWPDGYAFNVVDSIRRCSFTPGEPQLVHVPVGSTAVAFRAGHRIRVEVSSSNFPRFDRNPSTSRCAAEATVLAGADQTVHHGGRALSRLTLPVFDDRWKGGS